MPCPALSWLARKAVAGGVSLWAAAAIAAPPPPALVPEELARPIDGYDMEALFQVWRHWVESQKGAATESLLTEPEAIAGERPFGAPLLRFTRHNDFGHYLTGEIRTYCRFDERHSVIAGSCHYLLRRAYVPHDAAVWEGDNAVARWTRESFDPPRLAAHLRASGMAPDSDWWMLDRARIFAALPSAVPMLTENATLVRLDSRDCPAMARALAALESERLDWRVDLLGVGEDGPLTIPAPHSIRTVQTLTIRTSTGGVATIEGSHGALEALLAPALDAADACERARTAAGD